MERYRRAPTRDFELAEEAAEVAEASRAPGRGRPSDSNRRAPTRDFQRAKEAAEVAEASGAPERGRPSDSNRRAPTRDFRRAEEAAEVAEASGARGRGRPSDSNRRAPTRDFQRAEEAAEVAEASGAPERSRPSDSNRRAPTRDFRRAEEAAEVAEASEAPERGRPSDSNRRAPTRDFRRAEEAAEVAEASGALGRGRPSDSNRVDFVKIVWQTVRQVQDLLGSQKLILNEFQCWDLSTKLSRAAYNIEQLVHFSELAGEVFEPALTNFLRVAENAKHLVESCCHANWCQAAAFQINNEEAFREILLDAGLCYDEIYEEVGETSSSEIEDLRQSSAFSPAPANEVLNDQKRMYSRIMDLVAAEPSHWTAGLIQRRRLGLHLLERLHGVLDLNESRHGSRGRPELGVEWDKFNLGPWGECYLIRKGVYEATWLGMSCAKKVFKFNEWNPSAFAAEATALPMLNHPNIVKFFHCDHDPSTRECYVAMELTESNLQEVIHQQLNGDSTGRKPPFRLPVAVDIMIQIASGMCYLHDHDVAHRHLKPENTLVRRSSHTSPYQLRKYLRVKLSDFGLLKATELRSSTSSGGPSVYGAPEAFSQDGRRSPKIAMKSDVYSFGVLASLILTGKKPFEGIAASRLNEAILNNTRPNLPERYCPAELASVIRDCWVSDYRRRPTFQDVCCRLENVRHRLSRGGEAFRFRFQGSKEIDLVENLEAVGSYAQGMCSKRSAVRQRSTAMVRDDQNSASTRLAGIHSSKSMPTGSRTGEHHRHHTAGSSTSSPFVSDTQISTKSETTEEADVSTLVSELITKLSSRRTEVHRDAANHIRCLAKMNSENRVCIAEKGGIPFLINHLRSTDKMTQEYAITALLNLSLQESNRGLIMRAGAIDAIVHVVKWGQSQPSRENAAATIQCLSYSPANTISIGNTGAIPALVDLFQSSPQARRDSLKALYNLVSGSHDSNKRRALETGLVPLLVDILHHPSDTSLDDISLAILANLSSYAEGLVEIASTEPVAMLIGFLDAGSAKGKELAMALLWKLCQEDRGFVEAAYYSGVVGALTGVVRDEQSTERCKRKAIQLLNFLGL